MQLKINVNTKATVTIDGNTGMARPIPTDTF